MFNKENRYVTCGINTEMPLLLQLYLWNCIDEQIKSKKKVDYLQVFRFRLGENNTLTIEHTQEQPNRKTIYTFPYSVDFRELINRKVFVIDDIDHSTMLWADEY